MRSLKFVQHFDETTVIDTSGAFGKIPKSLLLDFLPKIYNFELAILESWKRYFESIGTPYAVTQTKEDYKDDKGRQRVADKFVLWKQQRA
jgi:hypothetical protein